MVAKKTGPKTSTVVSPPAVAFLPLYQFHGLMTEFHLYLYGPSRGPLESSFEEAESRLTQLPKLFFEPDGSFLWVLESGKQRIDGMIYDAAGKIQYCSLRGICQYPTWRELRLAITGDPDPVLEVLVLPDRELQSLQLFEQRWLKD